MSRQKKQNRGAPFKATALALVFVFALTGMGGTMPAVSFASTSVPARPDPGVLSKDLETLALPGELGKVRETYRGKSDKIVILVQDAHSVPDAQRNIRSIIEYFQDRYGVSLVGLEGASETLDPQIFRSFPDPAALKKTFEEYSARGELTGGTEAALFNRSPSTYLGIEDWSLYEEGVAYFLKAEGMEQEIKRSLDLRVAALNRKKEAVYSKELLELDRLLTQFEENRTDLAQVLTQFDQYLLPPKGSEIAVLLEEIKRERTSDTSVDAEIGKIAAEVETSLKGRPSSPELRKELQGFYGKRQEYQTSRMSPQAFALFLKDLAKQQGIKIKVSRQLATGVENQKRLKDIEGTRLFEEFNRYADAVKEKLIGDAPLATRDPVKSLNAQTQEVALLKRFAQLKLSFGDWTVLKKILDQGIASGTLGSELRTKLEFHIRFYQIAAQRDEAFYKNINASMEQGALPASGSAKAAILVAGGFHTGGLTQAFKEKGISYVLVMPRIDRLPEESLYRDHMQGNVSWKHYFEVKNGKVNFYEAFVRATRDKLLSKNDLRSSGHRTPALPAGKPSPTLKQWRDQIIRDLAEQGRLAAASQYTRFMDELSEPLAAQNSQREKKAWLANIDRFGEGLKKLQKEGRLSESGILQFIQSIANSEPVLANVLAPKASMPWPLKTTGMFRTPETAVRSETRTTPLEPFSSELLSLEQAEKQLQLPPKSLSGKYPSREYRAALEPVTDILAVRALAILHIIFKADPKKRVSFLVKRSNPLANDARREGLFDEGMIAKEMSGDLGPFVLYASPDILVEELLPLGYELSSRGLLLAPQEAQAFGKVLAEAFHKMLAGKKGLYFGKIPQTHLFVLGSLENQDFRLKFVDWSNSFIGETQVSDFRNQLKTLKQFAYLTKTFLSSPHDNLLAWKSFKVRLEELAARDNDAAHYDGLLEATEKALISEERRGQNDGRGSWQSFFEDAGKVHVFGWDNRFTFANSQNDTPAEAFPGDLSISQNALDVSVAGFKNEAVRAVRLAILDKSIGMDVAQAIAKDLFERIFFEETFQISSEEARALLVPFLQARGYSDFDIQSRLNDNNGFPPDHLFSGTRNLEAQFLAMIPEGANFSKDFVQFLQSGRARRVSINTEILPAMANREEGEILNVTFEQEVKPIKSYVVKKPHRLAETGRSIKASFLNMGPHVIFARKDGENDIIVEDYLPPERNIQNIDPEEFAAPNKRQLLAQKVAKMIYRMIDPKRGARTVMHAFDNAALHMFIMGEDRGYDFLMIDWALPNSLNDGRYGGDGPVGAIKHLVSILGILQQQFSKFGPKFWEDFEKKMILCAKFNQGALQKEIEEAFNQFNGRSEMRVISSPVIIGLANALRPLGEKGVSPDRAEVRAVYELARRDLPALIKDLKAAAEGLTAQTSLRSDRFYDRIKIHRDEIFRRLVAKTAISKDASISIALMMEAQNNRPFLSRFAQILEAYAGRRKVELIADPALLNAPELIKAPAGLYKRSLDPATVKKGALALLGSNAREVPLGFDTASKEEAISIAEFGFRPLAVDFKATDAPDDVLMGDHLELMLAVTLLHMAELIADHKKEDGPITAALLKTQLEAFFGIGGMFQANADGSLSMMGVVVQQYITSLAIDKAA